VLALGYFAYIYYPIYIGQKRFHDIQSEIEIGMKREQVLTLANKVGYFDHVSDSIQSELNGQKTNVKVDIFSYANFMLTSELIIEYNSNGQVKNITIDQ